MFKPHTQARRLECYKARKPENSSARKLGCLEARKPENAKARRQNQRARK